MLPNPTMIIPAMTTMDEIPQVDRLFHVAFRALKAEEAAGRLSKCQLGFDPTALGAKVLHLTKVEGSSFKLSIARADPSEVEQSSD